MRWRYIVFMTVVLVFILTSPAVSQPWLDFKDSKDLRLFTQKTFKLSFGEFLSSNITCRRKRIWISGEQREPFTWEVKGDHVCVLYLIKHTIGSFNVTRRTQTSM